MVHRPSNFPTDRNYFFGFRCVQGSQVGQAVKGEAIMPQKFRLGQNYPNPFNPSTTIEYSIPLQSQVTVRIFDILGREVAVLVNEKKDAGRYSVQWNASAMPSGIYFYRFETDGMSKVRKMTLIK